MMKQLKTSLTVLCLSLLMAHVQAQDFVFRVLASKGDNQMKTSGEEDAWKPIRTGEKLQAGDELKVAEDTYLGLVHHTGRTLEIKQAGHFHADELSDRMKEGENSVLGKYASFLISKMNEEEEDMAKDYKKYQNATGAVKRALSTATALKVLMPHTAEAMGPAVTVRWTEADLPQAPAYLVTLKNKFSKTIKTLKTEEPFVILDLSDSECVGEELIIFDVRVAGKKRYRSEEYGIKKMSAENINDIQEELNTIIKEGSSPSAMDYLLLASFFEEKNLLLDAITAYEKTITLEPEVPEFKLLYSRFIKQQKF